MVSARHNSAVNPALANDNADWGGNGTAPVRTAVSGFGRANAARYTDGTFVRTAYGAATVGLTYTLSVYVRTATFGFSGTAYIEWQDASHGALSYTGAGFSVSAGVVTRISVTDTAPASTAFAALIVGNETFAINTFDCTELLIEESATADTYFDGDTSGATWDGTAGNSASTLNDEQTISLGRAVETDTGQTLTASKTAAAGRATETDTARTLTASKTLTFGRASETDTSRPLVVAKELALTRASGTDTARPLTVTKTVIIGRATETSTASAVTAVKSLAVGRASETDAGQTVTASKTANLGRASDTGTARTLTVSKTAALGRAVETDTGRTLTTAPVTSIDLGRATEAATGRTLTLTKTVTIGRALESDTARTLTVTGGAEPEVLHSLGGTLIASNLGGVLLDTPLGGTLT